MKLGKILYATDFSASSELALEYASTLAAATGATLLVVHVDDETPGLVFGNVGYGYVPKVDEIARQQYDRLLQVRPASPQVPYEHVFMRGEAAEQILQLAAQELPDVIVIGTHGRTGAFRVLMGSVAESLVRQAKCPVMTVKMPIALEDEPIAGEGGGS
ncbi:universal stress protein [Adhaeretor mobilis]|uniref:Universal stress protein n=1 Tax=Adhaeretor mobilis TaxID=1930276 RepID=A0A517MZE4_9BACT|nr:universal stress protein [Adhaeretor mobilis]QDT00247.1 Universal stress protein [Adhaeretor mobilis]